MIMIEDFKKEVLKLAEEIGVEPREIHIRKMKNKWASCSSKGRLSFSFELLNQPGEKRIEVVIHELLHLKYPNHGELFQALLKTYLEKHNKKRK
ncbi:MAG: M48 family metallopeptidase [Candidatus Pacearchaeota archaeon]|nr:M48 family metallopeptidase [Candidatus Pacearchaeota archaeon]